MDCFVNANANANARGATFIDNERHTRFQVTVWILPIWQKKHRSTKEKMAGPTSIKKQEAWNDFNSVADNVL